MSVAAKIGRKAIRLTSGAVDTAIVIAALLLVAIGCYAMWDVNQVFQRASASQYAIYRPSDESGQLSFRELQKINPEVTAWLTVYGTHIDYPVVHSPDNMKYINTDAMGRYSPAGAIFLDRNCNPEFTDFNNIVYGHHMDKQAMFGEIGLFAGKGYFDARAYGALYCGGREYGLAFFAFVHADAYDRRVYKARISGWENSRAYLDTLLSLAAHTRDVPVTPDDRIVLLSTCSASSTNGRDILIAKITDELYEDVFDVKNTDDKKALAKVDGLPGLWSQLPLWGKAAFIGLPLFILLLLSLMIHNNRKKRDRKLPDKGVK